MPRYHFNIHNGASDIDAEGIELADLPAAEREALQLAGGILRDQKHWTDLGEEWRLEVADGTGRVLFRMDFAMSEPPVMAAGART